MPYAGPSAPIPPVAAGGQYQPYAGPGAPTPPSNIPVIPKSAPKPAAPQPSVPQPPVQPPAPTVRKDPTAKLLDTIARIESNYSPTILVGNVPYPDLTKLTLAQVQELHTKMKSGTMGKFKSTAVGKYQITEIALLDLLQRGGFKLTDVYDEITQDRMATKLMELAGLNRYLNGGMSRDVFMNSLAQVWASLPLPNGQSYYAGIGGNKAGISRREFEDLFMAQGGITTGPSIVGEAGAEAVIPLKGGNVPVDLGEVGEIIRQLGDLPNPDRLQQNLRDSIKVDIKTAIKDLASELAKPKPNQIEMLDLLRNIKRTHETSAEITAKIARSSMH